MSAKKALERMERISAKRDRILELRNRANEYAEQFIPQVYKDGDERVVTRKIYDQLVAFGQELNSLEGHTWSTHFGAMIPEYRGAFGTIRFVVSNVDA